MEDKFKNILKDNLHESSPANFTNNALEAINKELEKRSVVEPLIGKSTWVMIVGFLLFLLGISLFNINAIPSQISLRSITDASQTFTAYFTHFWTYGIIAAVVIWEFVIRRQFQWS